jgi:hypothetical protein
MKTMVVRSQGRWLGRRLPAVLAAVLLAAVLVAQPAGAAAGSAAVAAPAQVWSGSVNGADYRLEVPDSWNGTLLLFSHEYRLPGADNPPAVTPSTDEVGARLEPLLLQQGYALAGSAFRTTGWAVPQRPRSRSAAHSPGGRSSCHARSTWATR